MSEEQGFHQEFCTVSDSRHALSFLLTSQTTIGPSMTSLCACPQLIVTCSSWSHIKQHLYCNCEQVFFVSCFKTKVKAHSSFGMVPWVVSSSVLPDMTPQQKIKGSVPDSCCSRVRCYTWSLGSGCTCHSKPPPLWHTPKRQTEAALSCFSFDLSFM